MFKETIQKKPAIVMQTWVGKVQRYLLMPKKWASVFITY